MCLVDIGGGTTDIAAFTDGAIRHTAVIPIAGDQVTNDIAVALRTPTQYAEDIKIKYGCALTQIANASETIEVPGVGERRPRRLARQTLAEVIEPYDELFTLVQVELRRSGFEDLIATGVERFPPAAVPRWKAVELAEEVWVPVVPACRRTSAAWSTWCATRSMRLASVCRLRAPAALYAQQPALQQQRWRQRGMGEDEELVPGQFLILITALNMTNIWREGEQGMFTLMDSYAQNAVIKVVGIGGGGGNAVEHMVAAD